METIFLVVLMLKEIFGINCAFGDRNIYTVNLLFAIFVVDTSTGGETEITTSNSSTLMFIIIGVVIAVALVCAVIVIVIVIVMVAYKHREKKRYDLLLRLCLKNK